MCWEISFQRLVSVTGETASRFPLLGDELDGKRLFIFKACIRELLGFSQRMSKVVLRLSFTLEKNDSSNNVML